MFGKLFSALFRSAAEPAPTASQPKATNSIPAITGDNRETRERDDALVRLLSASTLFKPERREVILRHLRGGGDLHKLEPFLTADQKRAVGLNTRSKFSAAFVDCLTPEGIAHHDPKEALAAIGHMAFHKAARAHTVRSLRELGVKQLEILNCDDERDCRWIRKKANRLHPVAADVEALIEQNCDAEYCRCTIVTRDR